MGAGGLTTKATKEGRGMVEAGQDEIALSVGVCQVSQIGLESGAEEVGAEAVASHPAEGREAVRLGVCQVSRVEARMTNDQCPNDQGGRGDLGLSVGVCQVSQFEAEMGAGGLTTKVTARPLAATKGSFGDSGGG
jgi:hypothetical protein